MAKVYILSERAQQDMEDIWWHIAQDNPGAADKVSRALYDAYELLVERPRIGHKRDDLTRRALRFWPVYSYLIVYEPDSDPISILHVLSSYRDLETLLDTCI